MSIATPRSALVDRVRRAPMVLRRQATRVPERLQPIRRTVHVQAYDDTGRLVHDIRGDASASALLCLYFVQVGLARAEGYGPVRAQPALADVRRAAGQEESPRLAVLTRTIELDLGSSAFTEAAARPIVVTTEAADPARVREAEQVADVLVAGERTVDLRLARQLLVEAGLPRILSEGGPRVLAELYAN